MGKDIDQVAVHYQLVLLNICQIIVSELLPNSQFLIPNS